MTPRIDSTLVAMERALDRRLARHSLLSSNMANIDTPGFVPRDLERAGFLEPAQDGTLPLERTSPSHLAGGSEETDPDRPVLQPDRQPGLDGNAVDLDHQMVFAAQNSIAYAAVSRVARKKIALLKYAVSGGGV